MAYKRPSRRKYHFIYETRCLVTGRFYRGKHSTDNLEDGYLGSGTWIQRGIKAHGKERYERTILEFCSFEELDGREKDLIDVVNDNNLCMNIAKGGDGGNLGFSWADLNKIRNKELNSEKWKDPSFRASRSEKMKLQWENPEFREKVLKASDRTGSAHSQETKVKMSESHKNRLKDPTKNSQFGTCWVMHLDHGSKKIKLAELDSYLKNGWIKGRKMPA